jgi:protein-S-isoprenylcysteine O-methyltransferase Ste14
LCQRVAPTACAVVGITWTGICGDIAARSAPPPPAVKLVVIPMTLAPTPLQAFRFTGYCWLVFVVFWLLAALNVKRTTERWSPATGFGYFVVSVLIFNLLVRTQVLGRTLLIPHGPVPSWLAIVAAAAGLGITLWARVVLGRNWSGSITHKEGHELVEGGPYRFVRHPIYTGMLLMIVGTASARGTWDAAAALVLFTVVHIWKLQREEELMTRHFPETYPAYRARTKALIPFLY